MAQRIIEQKTQLPIIAIYLPPSLSNKRNAMLVISEVLMLELHRLMPASYLILFLIIIYTPISSLYFQSLKERVGSLRQRAGFFTCMCGVTLDDLGAKNGMFRKTDVETTLISLSCSYDIGHQMAPPHEESSVSD